MSDHPRKPYDADSGREYSILDGLAGWSTDAIAEVIVDGVDAVLDDERAISHADAELNGIAILTQAEIDALTGLARRKGRHVYNATVDRTQVSNGATFEDMAGGAKVLQPLIVTPVSGATGLGATITLTGSPFQVDGEGMVHASSDWQIASDAAFTTIVAAANASTSLTIWTSPEIAAASTFYARVRYRASSGLASAWSNPVSFSTRAFYAVRCNGLAWYESGAASPDSYCSLASNGTDGVTLSGNADYNRQGLGLAVVPLTQALMRRCVLKNDGSGVVYYLDADNSTLIAGLWNGTTQTGWLRVHEGYNDPVKPIPGQGGGGNAGLRALATVWTNAVTYARGDMVVHGGKLWISLSDDNLNIAPASGTSNATLNGSAGQVMVEIPRFYVYRTYTAATKRHAWDIAVDPTEVKPYPNLLVASTAPTSKNLNGLTFTVHPAFQKAGVERSHRYISAYRAYDNGSMLQSVTGQSYCNNKTRGAYRNLARARNVNLVDPSGQANNVWQLADMYLRHALDMLFLTEYRSFYAQALLGGGNQSGADYAKTTGRANAVGNGSGAYNSSGVLVTPNPGNDDDGVAYRGIEDFYGSMWDFTDGYNGLGNGTTQAVYLSNTPANFADDTATNYTAIGLAIPAMSGSYISALHDHICFLPSSVSGGSSSTYVTDGGWQAAANGTWYIAIVGGAANDGGLAGAFTLYVVSVSSHAGTYLGASLAR